MPLSNSFRGIFINCGTYLWCSSHNVSDVAVGLVEPSMDARPNAVLELTTSSPSVGEAVVTYAYPETEIEAGEIRQVLNFKATFYYGKLEDCFPHGRDRTIHPEPCYQTSIVTRGGASGGPVMGKDGRVFAVNSTGFDGVDSVSFSSRIDEILKLEVPYIKLPDGQEVSDTTVQGLAIAKWIAFEPPIE